jgi:WD40 repeat protein
MTRFQIRHSLSIKSSVLAAILFWGACVASRAESPAASPSDSSTVQPLTRIGKETTGFAVTCFALAPHGDWVALGSDDGNIRLWGLAENKLIRTFPAAKRGYIGSIAYAPDGKKLAFHVDDHPVQLLDIESGQVMASSPEEFVNVDQLRFSPSGALVGVIADDTALIWDLAAGAMRKVDQPAASLAFSGDGKLLATGFNTLRLVNVATGKVAGEFAKLDGRVTSLAFSPGGGQLLAVDAACPGTMVRLVEIESGEETLLGEKIRYERVGAAFSPDGQIVVVNDGFSAAALWSAETGQKLKTLAGFHRDGSALVFSSDGRRLLSGRNDSYISDLLVWDANQIVDQAISARR